MALAVLVAIVVMLPDGLVFVVPALTLGVGLATAAGASRRAVALAAAAIVCWALGWLFPVWWPNIFTAIVSAVFVHVIRLLAIAGIGIHLIAETSPTQLSAGLRAARIPRAISVTLAVMLRFFPVVAAETVAVIDAMRLRGLVGLTGILRHPILSIERFTVPMIAASLRASEDLSASAILRGLGSRHRPTAMIPPRFGWPDLLLVLIVAALTVAAFLLPSPLT